MLRAEAAGISFPLSPASNVNILEDTGGRFREIRVNQERRACSGSGTRYCVVVGILPQEEGERGG